VELCGLGISTQHMHSLLAAQTGFRSCSSEAAEAELGIQLHASQEVAGEREKAFLCQLATWECNEELSHTV
jgi:hypothetical protein